MPLHGTPRQTADAARPAASSSARRGRGEPGLTPARVPGDQGVRGGRSPGPAGVGLYRRWRVQQRLHDAPRLLLAVLADEEPGLSLQEVAEQPLVGLRRVPELAGE